MCYLHVVAKAPEKITAIVVVQCGEGDGACLGAYDYPLADFGESVGGAYPIGVLVGPINALIEACHVDGAVGGCALQPY